MTENFVCKQNRKIVCHFNWIYFKCVYVAQIPDETCFLLNMNIYVNKLLRDNMKWFLFKKKELVINSWSFESNWNIKCIDPNIWMRKTHWMRCITNTNAAKSHTQYIDIRRMIEHHTCIGRLTMIVFKHVWRFFFKVTLINKPKQTFFEFRS